MKILSLLGFVLVVCIAAADASSQTQPEAQSESAAINALYAEWSKATSTRGAEGYVSFFVADAAVLPPNASPVEGQDAIRQWIQKELDTYTVKDARFLPGPLRVANGWATRRFTISGKRVPKPEGSPVAFNNKYLDVLQKQSDGSWKFVYRMWSSNE
jgi:uncharacterized protein (TIGR02246 family)